MIRQIQNSEFAKIFRWVEELQSPQFNWSKESLLAEFLSGTVYGYVRDGDVLAFVCVRSADDHDEFTVLGTSMEVQGQGLMGQLLINALGQMSPGKQAWLEVHEANQSARYLYEKLGFRETGKRAKYYADGAAAILYTWERLV